jgi:hypothetical protein
LSIPLPQINLAGVSVGQTGIIDLTRVGIGAGGVSANPSLTKGAGTLHIFNESGSGLQFMFLTSGAGFYLPAGGWTNKPVGAGEQGLQWQVLYNLPSPPVTLLLVTYYGPGEAIPPTPTLGNSPIGIGGTVNTSSVNTLTNESNTSQTLVIDIGQSGHTLLITINSDGSASWSVLQSGVAHTIFNIQTSGNPIQIGKSGDIAEMLGNLTIDGDTIFDGFLGVAAQGDVLTAVGQDTYVGARGGANLVHIRSGGAQAGTDNATFGSGGMTLSRGTITLLGGSLSRINGGVNNCGNGTVISHGLGGGGPNWLVGTPWIAQPGSATVGMQNSTSTTFTATVGAGTQLVWVAGNL